jgi:subtilase-type serine protease
MTKSRLGALLLGTMILGACGGGDDDGGATTGGETPPGTNLPDDGPSPIDPPAPGASPFAIGYVTSFMMDAVNDVRNSDAFRNVERGFLLRVAGHPVYDTETLVESSPLTAARLDYALSTGLTGAGQRISIIDDGIRLSHEMFEGKDVVVSGAMGAGEHGTPVAGVAAGRGEDGQAIGFAPGADLHVGNMEFGAPVDFSVIADFVDDARTSGSIAMNNSWSLTGTTVNSANADAILSTRAFQTYVGALRDFAEEGVVVFSATNDYRAEAAELMGALPTRVDGLEQSWITVINAIPTFDEDRILGATRISSACLEAGPFCMTANGQIWTAGNGSDADYVIGTGASFAAPQVAGSVALLAEAFPTLTAPQLRDRLLASADNGFFPHDGNVDFGYGVTHGYNAEFGHGFLDLRAALLPIGTVAVTTEAGERIALGAPQVIGGGASGDAVARSLAAIDIVVTDGMAGTFQTDARALGGIAPINVSAVSAGEVGARDLGAERSAIRAAAASGGTAFHAARAGSSGSLADAAGLAERPVSYGGDTRVSILGGSGSAGAGLSIARSVDMGDAEFSFGLTHAGGTRGVLGVTAAGGEGAVSGRATGLQLGLAAPLGERARFRIEGEIGAAGGDGAGMISRFEGVRYDRISAAVDISDFAKKGDSLSLFASRPVAISGGEAMISVPVAYAASGMIFEDRGVGLAPADRQLDLGLEYLTPVGRDADLMLGATWSANAGHVSGARDVNARVGFQIRF